MGRHSLKSNHQPWRIVLKGALVSSAALIIGGLVVTPATEVPLPAPVSDPVVVSTTVLAAPTTTQPPTTTTETPVPETTQPTTTSRPPPSSSRVTTTTRAPEPQPVPQAAARSGRCNSLGVVKQIVEDGCNDITNAVNVPGSIGGYGLRPSNPTSCHPRGLGLDLGLGGVTRQGSALNQQGDEIAAYARANASRLGITLVLWETPDHWDHIHISFEPCNG